MEVFASAILDFYPNDADGLKKRIDEIGVKFEAITGGPNPAARGRGMGSGSRGRGGAMGRSNVEPRPFTPSGPNGGMGNTHFEDSASRQAEIDNHLAVIRFTKKFGGDHQKTNLRSPPAYRTIHGALALLRGGYYDQTKSHAVIRRDPLRGPGS
jgi:hypothetical protein